ncbi:MAG: hypothetical protein E7099_07700 [Mediterranea massiliensis]|nr:hypothetical protein [Mediterranea massiliensis]
MAKRKRKKNHWTTKNTHIQRKKKMIINEKDETFSWKWFILVMITVIYMLYKIIISQDRSGYDHFIGIPKEWIKWVK